MALNSPTQKNTPNKANGRLHNLGENLSNSDLIILTDKKEKTMTETNDKVAPIGRTSAGLRDAIFDEIDALRQGESNPTRANAVAKLANGIVETVRMEIDVQKHLRQNATSPTIADHSESALGKPMALGSA